MVTFCSRKILRLLNIFLFMWAGSVFAQQKNYHLPELIAAAKGHLPVLLQKQSLVNGAKAVVTDTKHSFLPQLKISDQLNLGTDNSIAGSYLPAGVSISSSAGVRAENVYQPASGNTGALYGEYELINFGLNSARLKTAEAFVDLQQADLEREWYIVQAAVARNYLTILKDQYKLDADQQNINRYDSIFKVIQALAASGIKPGADSSLARAELSRARITFNQTLGSINQLKDQLSYLTGIPADVFLIDSAGNRFISNTVPALHFASDTASNPLVDYYVKQNDVFLRNQTLIKKSYLPKVLLAASGWARGSSIQYNDDYKALSAGLGYQRFNYMAGIAVTYNLFNGLYKKDKLAISRFQVEAGGYALAQQQLAVSLAAAQAAHALQENEANLAELPVQLQSALATYGQKLAQYKAGIISLVDLTNASFVLYRSQTDYITTISDWWLAQLDKSVAGGNLIQFIQSIK